MAGETTVGNTAEAQQGYRHGGGAEKPAGRRPPTRDGECRGFRFMRRVEADALLRCVDQGPHGVADRKKSAIAAGSVCTLAANRVYAGAGRLAVSALTCRFTFLQEPT